MQHGRQAQLIDVLKLDLDRPRAQVELIGECDQMRERRSFQRYRMPAPQRRQIYAVAMEARDHREASQTAFSRFRLQDHRHAPASGEIQKFEHVLSCLCLVCAWRTTLLPASPHYPRSLPGEGWGGGASVWFVAPSGA